MISENERSKCTSIQIDARTRVDALACSECIRMLAEPAEIQRGGNCERCSRPTSSQSVGARCIIWREVYISRVCSFGPQTKADTWPPHVLITGWPGAPFAVVPLLPRHTLSRSWRLTNLLSVSMQI